MVEEDDVRSLGKHSCIGMKLERSSQTWKMRLRGLSFRVSS